MEQYIPISVLLAEIERIQKILNLDDCGGRSVMAWSEGFKNFLNTIEVKEVDLNEEIESYFKGFGKFASVGIDDCIDIAKHFFELGMAAGNKVQKGEEVKEKIIAYIDKLLEKYPKNYYLLMVAEFIDTLEVKEEPVSKKWIEELRTKLDSQSKEDFKKVFDKYAVDFNEELVMEEAANKYAIESYPDEPSTGQFGTGEYESYVNMSGQRECAVEDFKAGAKWRKEQIEKVLLSEVLPCFMHGGEADEVVAKLDEVLNQKK